MQELIVSIIVLAATWMVAKRYAPLAWKSAFSRIAIRTANRLGSNKLAKKLESKQLDAPSCASGCATCGGCSMSQEKTPASEFVVMMSNLKSRKAEAAFDGKMPRQ